jgi:CubicO group peptidase (beta-lactamase class C family)
MIGLNAIIWSWYTRVFTTCVAGIAVATISSSLAAADFHAVDDLMSNLMSEDNVPGAALALIKDGRIVLEKAYGFRDLAAHAPVTTATVFNIGSISKSFTALDIAELVDQQLAALDTPVIRYIPELRLSDPYATQVVTLRQLLSHTSGLPPDDQWPPQVPPSREAIVSEFARMPITAQPGTRFQYCSRCVVLAAYVLERITGESWETYTRTHILAPLAMTNASFGPLPLEQAHNPALPYRHDVIFGEVQVPWGRLQYLQALAPAGGINANVDEMARYVLLQLNDGTFSGHRILSPQMMTELHRPEITVGLDWTPAARTQNLHYALGWFTADVRGVHVVFHNGANPGFRAAIAIVPASGAGVVILTNGESDRFINAATKSLLELLGR